MTDTSRPSGDDFALHARNLTRAAITGFRTAFTISGVVALILGVVLLVWPVKTVAVVAAVLGIDFIVTGAIRVGLGIFSSGTGSGHRLLTILLGLLLIAAGIIALRNLSTAAVSLLVLAVVVIGVGWIIDGVMNIVESRGTATPGWAIFYGIVSILAGLSVVSVPTWSAVWLVLFAGIALIVLGIAGIIRGIGFGSDVRKSI